MYIDKEDLSFYRLRGEGMINTIRAKQIEYYNRQILSIFIDDQPLGELLYSKTGDSSHKDLWCSWLLGNSEEPWERHGSYIWSLLEDRRNGNLPILLCPDDMDFWCPVIVAKVRYDDNIVAWEKLGLVTGAIDVKQWRESGIQNLDMWSKRDWELYGESLAGLPADDKAWEKWCSEHWPDEETRRLWNYFHPYFNDDRNIKWLSCESFYFPVCDYNACVSAFKHYIIPLPQR